MLACELVAEIAIEKRQVALNTSSLQAVRRTRLLITGLNSYKGTKDSPNDYSHFILVLKYSSGSLSEEATYGVSIRLQKRRATPAASSALQHSDYIEQSWSRRPPQF